MHPEGSRAGPAAGFTLIELLVVLAILGLLGATAPRLLDPGGPRLRAAVHRLGVDLVGLREEASRLGQPAFLTAAPQGYLLMPSGRVEVLPAGVKLLVRAGSPTLLDQTPEAIGFYPDGSSTGGQVTLTRGHTTSEVSVRWLDGTVHAGG